AGEAPCAVRAATKPRVGVKMSREAGSIVAGAKACEEAGADAITAINTIRGMSIDVEQKKLRLHNRTGGFSGPALRPIALRIVWEIAGAVAIPVIAIGGVATTRDAIEFMLAGAPAVPVGTANFVDPCASKRILDGLRAHCEKQGVTAASLIGGARP